MLVINKVGKKPQVDMNVEEAYKRETPIKQGRYHLGYRYTTSNCLL